MSKEMTEKMEAPDAEKIVAKILAKRESWTASNPSTVKRSAMREIAIEANMELLSSLRKEVEAMEGSWLNKQESVLISKIEGLTLIDTLTPKK